MTCRVTAVVRSAAAASLDGGPLVLDEEEGRPDGGCGCADGEQRSAAVTLGPQQPPAAGASSNSPEPPQTPLSGRTSSTRSADS